MANQIPPGAGGPPDPLDVRTWLDEPYVAAPLRLMDDSALLPGAQCRIIIALLARQFRPELPGISMDVRDLVLRTGLPEGHVRYSIRQRIEAGWIEETGQGKFALKIEPISRPASISSHRGVGAPASVQAQDEEQAVPMVDVDPDLPPTWSIYLTDREIQVVRYLMNVSWLLRRADARVSVREIATWGKPKRYRPAREREVKLALTRLRLMNALRCIEAPDDADPTSPGIYRLNREWHRDLPEP